MQAAAEVSAAAGLDETVVLGGALVAALALTAVVKGDAFVVKGKAKEVYAPRGNPKPVYERKGARPRGAAPQRPDELSCFFVTSAS